MHCHPKADVTQKGRLRLVTQQLEHGRSLAELAAKNLIRLRCGFHWKLVAAQMVQPLWRIDGVFAAASGGRSIRSNCSTPWNSGTSSNI
jgi:hypothetical protein